MRRGGAAAAEPVRYISQQRVHERTLAGGSNHSRRGKAVPAADWQLLSLSLPRVCALSTPSRATEAAA